MITLPAALRANPRPVGCDLPVPAGLQLAFRAYAQGVQIYRWTGMAWAFVGPSAVLYENAAFDGAVGIHYGGPTWESVSGGKVLGKLLDKCTADPNAIPWLSLEGKPDGPGVFQYVKFIQRLNTTGGLAPAYAGTAIDELAKVPYTAEYYFYRP
jgi:hypothetical protein